MVIKGGCPHDCPDTCAWEVTVEEGRAVKLLGARDHPYTRGGLCAKVNHYLDRVYSPDRVLYPMRRVGAKGEGRFERVSWGQALEEIAGRFQSILEAEGGEAILPYSYAGKWGSSSTQAWTAGFSLAWGPAAWPGRSAETPPTLA